MLPWGTGRSGQNVETGQRLLVVEDNLILQQDLVALLEQAHYQVRGVQAGQDAIAELGRETYDLMLLDVQLPDIDGMKVLEMAQRHQPQMVVLMVTGFGTVELAVQAMRNGATDMITKPYDPTALLATVSRVIKGQTIRGDQPVITGTSLREARTQLPVYRLPAKHEVMEPLSKPEPTGRRQIYEQGFREGQESAHAILTADRAILASLIREVSGCRQALQRQAENELVLLAIGVAHHLTKTRGQEDRQVVLEVIKRCLQKIPQGGTVTALVNPKDVATLRSNIADVIKESPSHLEIIVQADEAISPGGCQLVTTHCTVDGTLESQIRLVAHALTGHLPAKFTPPVGPA